jgi:hypothetical protein
MIYKYLHTTQGEPKILARIDDDNICRLTCTEHDPEYLKWIEEGNTVLPAEENQ